MCCMVSVSKLGVTIKNKEIVKDISFEVQKGEIFGLIGGNGSGKTVIMKCISGLFPYTEGEIKIDGKMIGKDLDYPEELGLMIETPQFVGGISGYKNLSMLTCYRRKISKKDILNVLREVGLDCNLRLPVKKYSLGMRQRLGIAQAIMENPKILILDEPFNSLDDDAVTWFRNWLIEYKNRGNIVILSSHNKDDINFLCDKVITLKKGKILLT